MADTFQTKRKRNRKKKQNDPNNTNSTTNVKTVDGNEDEWKSVGGKKDEKPKNVSAGKKVETSVEITVGAEGKSNKTTNLSLLEIEDEPEQPQHEESTAKKKKKKKKNKGKGAADVDRGMSIKYTPQVNQTDSVICGVDGLANQSIIDDMMKAIDLFFANEFAAAEDVFTGREQVCLCVFVWACLCECVCVDVFV
jgi:hypothetical protein